ncbi:uncharacterized protein ARMOST_07657 [Armillaria ostoyae]|uniref:Peptidase C14 caspase domain-containing protein n=1 Tax=Armillaria ostoyae TaxID=47428 RepID=A0A284R6E8_ARMOS|nr:uncharacterized protein ARMOST_07657 [Armillaria ostoyae]
MLPDEDTLHPAGVTRAPLSHVSYSTNIPCGQKVVIITMGFATVVIAPQWDTDSDESESVQNSYHDRCHQLQATSGDTPPTGEVNDTPAQLRNEDKLKEIRRLEEVENRLARKYKMASPEGICIDPVAVFQEAKRRARSPRRRLQIAAEVLFLNDRSTLENDDVVLLQRLYHLRYAYATTVPHRPVSRESPSLTQGAPHRIDASRFWAVLIGIDAYKRNPLRGCVSDALLMRDYLIDDLGVPEERIQCLLGSKKPIPVLEFKTPSRANIVDVLHSLVNKPEIKRGDNIVVYYAGHGSSYRCQKDSCLKAESGLLCGLCPTEALCPLDRDTLDAGKSYIPDISDRELNVLFTHISRAKGHKITFIADCCYSSSTSRADEVRSRFTRAAEHTSLIEMLKAAHNKSVLSNAWHPDTNSHVLLAACNEYETAHEAPGKQGFGGVFTKTLIHVLRSDGWKMETTYIKLSELLGQLGSQSPVVAGAQLGNQDLLKEIRRLEEVENRLARKYKMASPEGICIDSVAVLEEAKRRATSLRRRLQIAAKILFLNDRSTLENDDVVLLQRLYHLRYAYATTVPHRPVSRESPSLTQGAPHRIDASRFWAVLIGIDAYKRNPLRGCVSDALLMRDYLIDDLGVPEERIQCLLGPENPIPGKFLTPSRTNIVDVLYSLIDNQGIDPGDNMLLYFAGHGASYYCSEHFLKPECDNNFCPTEALCPLDRDTVDAEGRYVPDISDRELNALFTEISRVKGNKITFIADCCYARSFSRHSQDLGMRSVHPTTYSDVNDMLRAADERLKHFPGYRSILSEDWQPDMSSHVVLAACRDYQTAKETWGKEGFGGVFTTTLVRVLKSDHWKKETTYVELTHLLNQSYTQTPVVAGVHKFEGLWYAKP